MFNRILSTPGRMAAAIATAALLAGAMPSSAESAAPDSRARAASNQTSYFYYADATYKEIVGHATSGCGEPYTLHFGYTTSYVHIGYPECPY